MSSQVIDGWKPIRGTPGKTIVTQNSDGSYTVTIDPSAIGDGSGDMLKAVYDIDGNDIVDAAESVPWGGVTGKPLVFPPDAHTHSGSDVTSQVSSAASAESVPWAGITDVPSTFTPSSHDHDDRYYTETEIGTILTGYSVTTHDHDLDYSALSHDHDDRYYTESEIGTILGGYVAKSLYDANTILYATTDDTPTALTVGASTIVGRGAAGGIAALSAGDARTVLGLGTMATEAAASYVANALLTTRGDIIVRNATVPERLALTVPSSPVINFLGVANGETQPSWKSASSNPGAAAAILATNASGVVTLVNNQIIGGYTLTMPETGTVVVRDAGAISSRSIPYFGNTSGKLAGTTGMYWDNIGQQFAVGNSSHPSKMSIDSEIGSANALTEGFSVGRAGYNTIRGYINMAGGLFSFMAHDEANNAGTLRFTTYNGTTDVERLRIATTGVITATNGLIVNESGGSAATDDFRAESDTEENMLWLDASADLLYLGGSSGVKISKGGKINAPLTDYVNNAAAIAGGLSAGDFYTQTGTNPKRVCVVY